MKHISTVEINPQPKPRKITLELTNEELTVICACVGNMPVGAVTHSYKNRGLTPPDVQKIIDSLYKETKVLSDFKISI